MNRKISLKLCVIILLLTVLLTACSPKNLSFPSQNGFPNISGNSDLMEDTSDHEEETTEIPYSEKMVLQDAGAPDDEWDFRYTSDFSDLSIINSGYLVYDSKSYDFLFPNQSVSLSDIESVCAANPDIPQKYKDFIIDYASRWLELYPESDLRVLHHNLKTLQIVEASSETLQNVTLTADAPACYVSKENTVYVKSNTDYSPRTPGYIILTHELTHVARSSRYFDEEDNKVVIDYYTVYDHGNYVSEALITLFAYELQGLGDDGNRFYMLPYNYFKIVLECTGYNGADYMNHSIYYLCDRMDEFMEEDGTALQMLLYFSAEAIGHYEPYVVPDYDEEQQALFHEYITRMYLKKYLDPAMTLEEAEAVYDSFIGTVTANFELSSSEQAVTADDFRPHFEQCLAQMEIA